MASEPPADFPTSEDEKFNLEFIKREQPEEWRVPIRNRIPCNGCGQYLTNKRENWTYDGDFAVTTLRLECQKGCMVSATVEYREWAPRTS